MVVPLLNPNPAGISLSVFTNSDTVFCLSNPISAFNFSTSLPAERYAIDACSTEDTEPR